MSQTIDPNLLFGALTSGSIGQLEKLFATASQAQREHAIKQIGGAVSPPLLGALQQFAECDGVLRAQAAVAILLEGGHLPEAQRRAAQLVDQFADAKSFYLLGVVAMAVGQQPRAQAALQKAVAANPAVALYHFQLGCCLAAGTDQQAAIAALAEAVKLAPSEPSYWLELGNCYKNAALFERAEQAFSRAIASHASYVEAFNNRGTVYKALGNREAALADFTQALQLNPRHLFARLNRAALLAESKQLANAARDYQQAIVVAPQNANGHYGLGEVLHQQGEHQSAIIALQSALRLAPKMPYAWLSIGNCLQSLGRFAEAIEAYQQSLQVDESFAEGYINWGTALQELCRHEEAAELLAKALQLRPDFPGANWNRANSLLCLALEKQHWLEYEKRHAVLTTDKGLEYPYPLLGDNPPDGQRLLMHWDQRFGDIIQVLRYVPQLQARAAHCIWQIAPSMRTLFEASFPGLTVVDPGDFDHPADYVLPMTSLPLALQTFSRESIPRAIPYLNPPDGEMQQWGAAVAQCSAANQLKIGVVWRGMPTPPGRSIDLEELSALFKVRKDAAFFSLQLGLDPREREVLQQFNVHNLVDNVDSFGQTAALIKQLDVVVTVDTSVAHLAGALGCATKVLLKYGGDWRWHLEGEHSDWYPTAQLYRQHRPRDWSRVVEQLCEDLR